MTSTSKKGLILLDGEELIYEGTPQVSALVQSQLVGSLFAMVISFGVLLPFLPFMWIASQMGAQKHRFYLTSHRVVVTTGIIGESTRSVPLERVSDVQLSYSWIDKMFGIEHVTIRDMTGEAQGGAVMQAVPDAVEVQQQILREVHRVNRLEGDAPAVRAGATTPVSADSEVVALLRQIAENTAPK